MTIEEQTFLFWLDGGVIKTHSPLNELIYFVKDGNTKLVYNTRFKTVHSYVTKPMPFYADMIKKHIGWEFSKICFPNLQASYGS